MKKMKIPLLYVLSFLCSVMPVLIYFVLNHESYISTTPERIKLLFGGIFKINSGIMLFSLVFVFSYLLEGIISDLLIFSFLALVGEVLAFIVRQVIKAEKTKSDEEKTEKMIENAVNKTSGRV